MLRRGGARTPRLSISPESKPWMDIIWLQSQTRHQVTKPVGCPPMPASWHQGHHHLSNEFVQRLHLESGRIACFSKCQFPYGWSERRPYSRWCVAFNKLLKTPLINSPVRSTISQSKACQVQYCVLRQLLLLSPIWYNMVQNANFLMVDLRGDLTQGDWYHSISIWKHL